MINIFKEKSYKIQFLPNLISNFLLIFVQGVSSLILTPFLIKKLNVELFGIVMLFVSISNYVYIFTISINNSAGRELILNFKSRDAGQANKTYNSFLFGNIGLTLLLLPAIFIANLYLTKIFNIPQGNEQGVHYLFIILSLSFLIHFVQSAFAVSSWSMNRFDIRNYNQIVYFVIRLFLVVFVFMVFAPKLYLFAYSYLLATLSLLLLDYLAFKKLTPQIRISLGFFSPAVLKKLWILSFWFSVSQVGTFLFFKFGLFLTNILLGAKSGGEFAAVLQLALLIQQIGFSIGTIMHPTFISMYAEGRADAMISRANQALKLMAVLLIPMVALLAGASGPLLSVWLGKGFGKLGLVLVLMLFSILFEMIVRPLYSINFAYNRIKIPSLITIAFGILNIVLTILFVRLNWGIQGVALAGLITLNLRSLVFIPIYTAYIQNIKFYHYLIRLIVILFNAILFTVFCALVAHYMHINNWAKIFLYFIVCGILYAMTVLLFVLNKTDKQFIFELIPGEWLRQRMNFLIK
jgi:O-antigen/teichoic acid export membrane protein